MDLKREKRLHDVLNRALELPTLNRQAFLESTCAEDPGMLEELMGMLMEEEDLDELRLPTHRAAQALGVTVGLDESEQEEALPRPMGPYTLVELIGEGGMGRVYRAEQEEPVRRQVALKILRTAAVGEALIRFEAERHAMGRLDHPNVGKLLEAGNTSDGLPFFVMELIEGAPVTTYCDRQALSLKERLQLFVDVCRGVEHAHRKLLLHRDLKPSNILVAEVDGRAMPKIIDFGIAKGLDSSLSDSTLLTGDRIIGTPAYMSPEALRHGEDVDIRSDVFSLGVVLYELLTGQRPWSDVESHPMDAFRRSPEDPIPRPSTRITTLDLDSRLKVAQSRGADPRSLSKRLRGDLDWITLKAIAYDPAERYGSVADLADDVERFLTDQPVSAHAPTTAYLIRKLARRHRGRVVAAALILATLVLGAVGTSLGLVRARAEAEEARKARDSSAQFADFLADLFQAAHIDKPDASTVTAREILDRGAQRIEKELAGQPGLQAPLQQLIAGIYLSWGRHGEARPLLQSALRHIEQSDEISKAQELRILSRWAQLLIREARYEEAQGHLDRAITIGEGLGDLKVADWVTLKLNAASAHIGLNELPAAERRLKQIPSKVPVRLQGDFHSVWGRYLLQMHEYDRAAHELRKSAEAFLRLGVPRRASSSYSSLGISLVRLRRFDEALVELHNGLEIAERIYGPEHHLLGTFLSNISMIHIQTEAWDQAEPVIRRSLELKRKELRPDHPRLAISYTHLGVAIAESGGGRQQEALDYFAEALRIMRANYPSDHPRVVTTAGNLALMKNIVGQYAEAESLLRECFVAVRKLGKGPQEVLPDLYPAWVEALVGLGREEEARVVYEEALEYGRLHESQELLDVADRKMRTHLGL